ncbi:MerR family transcriptional regulator [Corynebacterium sp. sy017]|uniref:transcriptional regulator FtsR n=1 Tax=unclassified Corynebacterium TaxID=2624378 RepID=UPI00118516BB|nr:MULTISPECIES: MerR family transcriptional regulator [unclassified Corynebacterium]MBP3087573.1 MerR family transcriptional regulator [Corynebacterium sp. sy017]TSD92149.1 MerR family transcriptional regulator [Corynebacterium sp. SY003]
MSALPSHSSLNRRTSSTKTMSIGVVLEQLKKEFPDVTVSKIRFLEAEGLVSPQRTSSGYRRFTQADLDRLRFILTTQRDNYLPLKVIREQLQAMDSGAITPLSSAKRSATVVDPENFRAPVATRLTDSDIASQAQVDSSLVAEYIDAGIIVPDTSGFFTADDVAIVITATQLKEFGFDVRHLKSLRNTASRQADLIERALLPMAKTKDGGAERAEEMTQEMMAVVVSLHTNFVKSLLRNSRR